MPMVTMRALLETGVHFGHQARKWNPKMDKYIFTKRNGIHIIDLQQTLVFCREIYDVVREEVAKGGTVLYVGTKRQAQEIIRQEADRAHMPYVEQRWLGGTLTNWTTIRQRLDTLERLERRRDSGDLDRLTKKERLLIERKIERLNFRLGGLRSMKRLPVLIFLIDTRREQTAVKEANILDIPIIALCDTNSDPDPIDYVIPANDDAIRAIKLLTGMITDAVLEGFAMRKAYSDGGDNMDFEEAFIDDDNDLLSPSTLAKIPDLEDFDDDFEFDDDDK